MKLSSSLCVLRVGLHHDLFPTVRAGRVPSPSSPMASAADCLPGDSSYNGWCYGSQEWWETDPAGVIWKHECAGGYAYNDASVWQQWEPTFWTPYAYGWTISDNPGSPYVFNNGVVGVPTPSSTMATPSPPQPAGGEVP